MPSPKDNSRPADQPHIQRLLWIAGFALVAFVWLEWCQKEPLVDLRLYTTWRCWYISLATLVNSMTFWGTGFLGNRPSCLQRLLDYTPALAGWTVLPGALVLAMMMLLAGRLTDIVDRQISRGAALGMFALGSYWFALLTLERPLSWMVGTIVWRYAAIPFIFAPLNTASLLLLPPDKVLHGLWTH